jgi:hypothetical protein
LERHFLALGFKIEPSSHIDLICVHPISGVRWQIEAKGKTAAMGLDFRTALGQLIQRMTDPQSIHAIAVPDMLEYQRQIALVSPWVVEALKLRWLVVDAEGKVEEVEGNTTS